MEKPSIMLAGLPGVGKTSLRKNLLAFLNDYDVYDNTKLRREFGYKKFNPRKDYKILEEVNKRMINSIRHGRGVILDSVHRHRKRRSELYEIVKEYGGGMLIIECKCPEEEVKRRLSVRNKKKDNLVMDTASMDVYYRHKKEWDEIPLDIKGRDFLSYVVYDSERKKFEKPERVHENLLYFFEILKKNLENSKQERRLK